MSVDADVDPIGLDFLEPLLPEDPEPDLGEPAPPAAEPKRKPGPPPNPRSQRQRRLVAKKAAAPAKKAVPNKPVEPDPAADPMEAGAATILGWVLQPLAVGGTVLQLRAQQMVHRAEQLGPPKGDVLYARAVKTDAQGQALTLDVLAVTVHDTAYTKGIAQIGAQVPMIGGVLERVAKVGPYATLVGAVTSTLLQVMCNHGWIPATAALGTLTPAELYKKAGIELPPPAA